jgi:hypothetical protein
LTDINGWRLDFGRLRVSFACSLLKQDFEISIAIVGGLKHGAISLFPVAIFELRVDLN